MNEDSSGFHNHFWFCFNSENREQTRWDNNRKIFYVVYGMNIPYWFKGIMEENWQHCLQFMIKDLLFSF